MNLLNFYHFDKKFTITGNIETILNNLKNETIKIEDDNNNLSSSSSSNQQENYSLDFKNLSFSNDDDYLLLFNNIFFDKIKNKIKRLKISINSFIDIIKISHYLISFLEKIKDNIIFIEISIFNFENQKSNEFFLVPLIIKIKECLFVKYISLSFNKDDFMDLNDENNKLSNFLLLTEFYNLINILNDILFIDISIKNLFFSYMLDGEGLNFNNKNNTTNEKNFDNKNNKIFFALNSTLSSFDDAGIYSLIIKKKLLKLKNNSVLLILSPSLLMSNNDLDFSDKILSKIFDDISNDYENSNFLIVEKLSITKSIIGDLSINNFFDLIKKSNIKSLSFSYNLLKNENINLFGDIIEKSKYIEQIHIQKYELFNFDNLNDIDNSLDFSYFFKSLKKCKYLNDIRIIGEKSISDKTIPFILEFIKNYNGVKKLSLNLSWCGINENNLLIIDEMLNKQ